MSNSFEIETGVRERKYLEPVIFNNVLEKVVGNWKKALKVDGIRGIHLGRKGQNLDVKCLAFADSLVL